MTIDELATVVIQACEDEGIDHMVTGAFATNCYSIPRSTKDVDVVVALKTGREISQIVERLKSEVAFDPQVQFDTLTWGKRLVGVHKGQVPLKVELFELFEDPFVQSQFSRRRPFRSPSLARELWVPTPEDIVVQKLRWGRSKDLDDARDVLAVQGPETLDMAYIEQWCAKHGTSERLRAALDSIPPL